MTNSQEIEKLVALVKSHAATEVNFDIEGDPYERQLIGCTICPNTFATADEFIGHQMVFLREALKGAAPRPQEQEGTRLIPVGSIRALRLAEHGSKEVVEAEFWFFDPKKVYLGKTVWVAGEDNE